MNNAKVCPTLLYLNRIEQLKYDNETEKSSLQEVASTFLVSLMFFSTMIYATCKLLIAYITELTQIHKEGQHNL